MRAARPSRSIAARVRGWAGKTTGTPDAVQALDDPAAAVGCGRSPRGGRSRPRSCPARGRSGHVDARARSGAKRSVASAITSPTTSIAPVHALAARGCSRRPLVRREQKRGDAVDLDPVPLLGHRQVAAPQPGLDVRDRDRRRRAGPAAGERSSSCRRRRAPSPAAPRRRAPRSAAASRRRPRCAGRAGARAPGARAPRRRPATSRRPSAGPCGRRPRRSRRPAAPPRAAPT